jgi:hypothetical protein
MSDIICNNFSFIVNRIRILSIFVNRIKLSDPVKKDITYYIIDLSYKL